MNDSEGTFSIIIFCAGVIAAGTFILPAVGILLKSFFTTILPSPYGLIALVVCVLFILFNFLTGTGTTVTKVSNKGTPWEKVSVEPMYPTPLDLGQVWEIFSASEHVKAFFAFIGGSAYVCAVGFCILKIVFG